MTEINVSWDPDYKLAKVEGPGGFTQPLALTERETQAIADALGVDLRMTPSGVFR